MVSLTCITGLEFSQFIGKHIIGSNLLVVDIGDNVASHYILARQIRGGDQPLQMLRSANRTCERMAAAALIGQDGPWNAQCRTTGYMSQGAA